MTWLNRELIERTVKGLNTGISFSPYIYKECSSTQEVARELAIKGFPEGTLVIAEQMTKGRGRYGRRWIAPSGGLWFTLLLRPRALKGLQLISLVAGISVAEAIRKATDLEAKIRWPNDVLLYGKKVAGILSEGSVSSNGVEYVLVGIGVNTNNIIHSELKLQAISLKELSDHEVDNYTLLAEILRFFDRYYYKHLEGMDDEIVGKLRLMCSTLNKEVKVITVNGLEITGKAIDLSPQGELVLNVKGEKLKIASDEVKVLRGLKTSSSFDH